MQRNLNEAFGGRNVDLNLPAKRLRFVRQIGAVAVEQPKIRQMLPDRQIERYTHNRAKGGIGVMNLAIKRNEGNADAGIRHRAHPVDGRGSCWTRDGCFGDSIWCARSLTRRLARLFNTGCSVHASAAFRFRSARCTLCNAPAW